MNIEMKIHEQQDQLSKINHQLEMLAKAVEELSTVFANNYQDRQLATFDYTYTYLGYVLLNEEYEDAEGFVINNWQWGKQYGKWVYDIKPLAGLYSNSYSDRAEALEVFKKSVELKKDCQ